jgi:hypothetical protein
LYTKPLIVRLAWIILFREIILAFRFLFKFYFLSLLLARLFTVFLLTFSLFFVARYRVLIFYLVFRTLLNLIKFSNLRLKK